MEGFRITGEGPGYIEITWNDGRVERLSPEIYADRYGDVNPEVELDFDDDSVDYSYDDEEEE